MIAHHNIQFNIFHSIVGRVKFILESLHGGEGSLIACRLLFEYLWVHIEHPETFFIPSIVSI